ncbi:MAG: TonB-dependent receptor plug domain-containing protein [Gammaproteobacteria bacterium]|nr:TonB-dependent receptor plug domain-containing protein [Gammaproteobacteria bacterium]
MSSFKPKLLASTIAMALLPGLLQAQILDEITVTAQKREQSVQDVGIAMSAFSGEQMEQLGFANAQQVTAMAPGVSTIQPNGEANYAIAIRGVASSDFTTNVESPVALYLDEVYISQMSGAGFQLYDMERVEILRGPQGTLFGRNATGGLAHFISNKPSQDFSGYVKGTIGDYDQIQGGGRDRRRYHRHTCGAFLRRLRQERRLCQEPLHRHRSEQCRRPELPSPILVGPDRGPADPAERAQVGTGNRFRIFRKRDFADSRKTDATALQSDPERLSGS